MQEHPTESAARSVLTCASGRMVILEQVEPARAGNETLAAMARDGKEEGYAIFAVTKENSVGRGGAPGLFLSMLVRPAIHATKAGQLAALAAVAAARAMEKTADMRVRIRWVNDLFCGSRKMAAMMTSARIAPSGYLDYAVIGISLALASEDFQPKLGDLIHQVFSGETRPLSVRLTSSIVQEFFSLYDGVTGGTDYMEEYRHRSTVIGKRVRVLVGDTYIGARVVDIDANAALTVEFRGGRRMTVTSRSEIVF